MKLTTAYPTSQMELYPASMLGQRQQWQKVRRMLPRGSCLLVTNPKNSTQAQVMKKLATQLLNQGKSVFVWMPAG